MRYRDLRDFLEILKERKQLHCITAAVDPALEITEVCDRVLQQQGPALLFSNPSGSKIPLLANLFGTTERVALGMGRENLQEVRELGELLAFLSAPEPPRGFKDAWKSLPILQKIMQMSPKIVKSAPCHEQVLRGADINLDDFPIQTCWPEDAARLITWGLVITRKPERPRQNLGIYRQQVIAKNKVIMRWLAHRGGALDYQAWRQTFPGQPFPVAVVLGSDPATLLAAVTPIPDHLSEYAFAGLLRGHKTELVACKTHDLQVPANAEIVLEGFIYPDETAQEGPFGDHTGYYNEVETFPVFTIECITMRDKPIYHSTYTGRPPDEPAILGEALNELFIPLLQKQFPEIIDFYLPPEGCSYRVAVVSIRKCYLGHAKRVMLGIWSYLQQFMYTKFIIITDEDVNVRDWKEVIWAISTRMDPARDTTFLEHTPIDYLDFASPVSGLGSKMGFDATNKWPGETQRAWGKPIAKNPEITKKIDALWQSLNL